MLRRCLAFLAFLLTAAGQQCSAPPPPWIQVAYTYPQKSFAKHPGCYYHNRITREDRDRLFESKDPCPTLDSL